MSYLLEPDPTNPLGVVLWKCGGPAYRTRDGRRAVVLEPNYIIATWTFIWQGRVEGVWTEWHRDGRHLGGDAALDLVGVWPLEPPAPGAVG